MGTQVAVSSLSSPLMSNSFLRFSARLKNFPMALSSPVSFGKWCCSQWK